MPIHASTALLGAELKQPTVMGRAAYGATAKLHRPSIARVSAQVSAIEELLVAVEEDEDNPEIQGKLESLRGMCRALDKQTTAAAKANGLLSQTLRRFFTEEIPDLLASIARNE